MSLYPLISFKLFNTVKDNNFNHFEYYILNNSINIGEFHLMIEKETITLSLFKISIDYRGLGFGSKSLLLIENLIYELKTDFPINRLELDVKPFNNSFLTKEELLNFYIKKLNMSVFYADKDSLLLFKDINHL